MKIFPLLLLLSLKAIAHAAPGDLDPTFGTGGKVITPISNGSDFAKAVAVHSDGKVVVAGLSIGGGNYDYVLARYTVLGELDPSFGTGGKVITRFGGFRDTPNSVAVQPDGKVVVAGRVDIGNNGDFALARYTEFGTPDISFGTDGKVITSFGSGFDSGQSVALQSDGKILVAGSTRSGSNADFALARFTQAGALDTTFGTGGKVITPIGSRDDIGTSVAVSGDGKILVAGYSSNSINFDFALARYTDGGMLDASFGTGGKVVTAIGAGADYCFSMALQSDGKILAAGYSFNGTNNDFALARFTANGTLDTTFGAGGKVTTDFAVGYDDAGLGVAILGDGKIVVGGYSGIYPDYAFAVARYTVSGALDTNFGTGGKATTDFGNTDDKAQSLAMQSDGKIVLAGSSSTGSTADFALTRYDGGSPGDADSDGLLDSWELTYWLTIAGHRAFDDFDLDGVPELLEAAFGLNPTLPDADGLPTAINEAGYLTMSFPKHAGVNYEVQSAGTLLDKQPDSFSPATTTILINDATTLKVRDNFLIGAEPMRYIRVKVTAAP